MVIHKWARNVVLTDGIFETGVYAVPCKSQNSTVLGQGGPSSTQYSNPSWAWCWRHPFGTNIYTANVYRQTTDKLMFITVISTVRWIRK